MTGAMAKLRLLRFALLNVILLGNLAAILKGGLWPCLAFLLLLVLMFPLDELFGDDMDNAELPFNWFLDANLFATLPLVFLNTLALVAVAAPQSRADVLLQALGFAPAAASGWSVFAATMSLAFCYGLAAIPAHELVHRVGSRWAQGAGRWIFAFNFDTTFAIEHVHGHHRNVGTSGDPATARRGETSFVFFVRATYQQWVAAFRFEAARLRRKGMSPLSVENRAVRGQLMSVLLAGIFFGAGGPIGLALFLVCALVGKFGTELLAYVSHYGLVRVEATKIEVRHSWNMRRSISGGVLLNASRHSHHHLFPTKPYWTIAAEPEGPRLPYGHSMMLLMSAIPPWWNATLDPLLEDWDLRHASPEERAMLAQSGKLLGGADGPVAQELIDQRGR